MGKNVEIVKKYYFRKNGKLKEPGYDFIGKPVFNNRLRPVVLNNKLGFTNLVGKIEIPAVYDVPLFVERDGFKFVNDRYICLLKDKLFGVIDYKGNVVIDFEWNGILLHNLSENLVPVQKDSLWGYFNIKTGGMQIEPMYNETTAFRKGRAAVRTLFDWGIIDGKGNKITEAKYGFMPVFEDDFAITIENPYELKMLSKDMTTSFISAKSKNVKLLNMRGHEMISNATTILRVGINTFNVVFNDDKENSINIQYVPLEDYIVVIENGKYEAGYCYSNEKFSTVKNSEDDVFYKAGRYIGGGTVYAVDYKGNAIKVGESKLANIIENKFGV